MKFALLAIYVCETSDAVNQERFFLASVLANKIPSPLFLDRLLVSVK